jgi:transcriptional repressor NrdR
VGEMVTDRLRRLDQVAYVRFASVYRQFKTLDDLVNEAKAVLDARRFEDPAQGRLFIEELGPIVAGNGRKAMSGEAEAGRRAKRGRKPRLPADMPAKPPPEAGAT